MKQSSFNHRDDTDTSLLAIKTPKHDPSPEDADTLLANEMNRLTVQEREDVLYDLHGINDIIQETPGFRQSKLAELDQELMKIPKKCAYELALEQSPSYVQNDDFRFLFLRADGWNATDAAQRMVAHFATKLDLFGKALLTETITQAHLPETSLKCLNSGYLQFLPFRDRSGRLVALACPKFAPDVPVEEKMRCCWYSIMIAMEDLESQTHGMVFIAYFLGKQKKHLDRPTAWKMMSMFRVLPVRCQAIHFCVESSELKPHISLLLFALNATNRVRNRCHEGSHHEIIYKVQTFGIPARALPFSPIDGELLTDWYDQTLQKRKKLELSTQISKAKIIGVPRNEDIVFGRGMFLQDHWGNIHFRDVIDGRRNTYDESDRKGKTRLASKIVQSMQETGGRFLKDDGMGWVEVEDKVARQKVSMAFRSHRKLAKLPPSKRKRRIMEVLESPDNDSTDSTSGTD